MTSDHNSEKALSFHFSYCCNRGIESMGGVQLWNLPVFYTNNSNGYIKTSLKFEIIILDFTGISTLKYKEIWWRGAKTFLRSIVNFVNFGFISLTKILKFPVLMSLSVTDADRSFASCCDETLTYFEVLFDYTENYRLISRFQFGICISKTRISYIIGSYFLMIARIWLFDIRISFSILKIKHWICYRWI